MRSRICGHCRLNRTTELAARDGRPVEPGSKLATARGLEPQAASSSLAEVLQLPSAGEDDLYQAMDWLLERQQRIENRLAAQHLAEGTLVLYDITSTYFEGRHCPLAKLGHSRDERPGNLPIVFGWLTNSEGCPVAVEVFAGNVADPKTVAAQVTKLRERFGLRQLVLVGDRGMIPSARIREDLKSAEGIGWITALRAPQLQKLASDGVLQLSLFDEQDLAEIRHPDYPGERLIAGRHPLLAVERARKREELLAATEIQLARLAAATADGLPGRSLLRGHGRANHVDSIQGRFGCNPVPMALIAEAVFSKWKYENAWPPCSGPTPGPPPRRGPLCPAKAVGRAAGARTRVPVPAGLLRGVAHAKGLGADPV